MIELKRIKGELKPVFENVKSFYNKAEFETIETKNKNKIHLLKSYKSLVCGVVEEADGTKWIYLNNSIQKSLLTSQTTLRHIKEFLKQFYKQQEYTKKELLKIVDFINFDFLLLKDTNNGESFTLADYGNYYTATSPEQKKFFKSFEGYKERQTADTQGKYLFTKCKYGYANYYYLYI